MKDPIGKAIHDYCHSGVADLISVDSNYTEGEEIDPAWFFRTHENMPPLEVKALQLCRGNILDIGAGAGCHALELQKSGLPVTAIDQSELSAGVMKARGVKHVICEDIFLFKGGPFDTILLLMNGCGIAGTLDGLTRLLLHLKDLLAADGQILLDSSDISYLFTEEDGSLWIDLSQENYYGEMSYEVSYKGIKSDPFPWLFIGPDLLDEIAGIAGFACDVVDAGENNDFLARLSLIGSK